MGLDRSSFLHILHVKFPHFDYQQLPVHMESCIFFHASGFVQLEPFKVCTEALPADRCGDIPDPAGTNHGPFLQVN